MKKLLGFLLGLCLLVSSASAQVSGVVGAQASNNTFPLIIPPCTTTGYSEDVTTTMPSGFNNGRVVAVDDVANLVYVITDDGVSVRLGVFQTNDLTTVGTILLPDQASFTLGTPGELFADEENGVAYYFYRVPIGGGRCAGAGGFTCLGSRTFRGASQISQLEFSSQQVTNVDYGQIDPENDLVYLQIGDGTCNAVGNQRCIFSFNTPALSQTALARSLATLDPGGNFGPLFVSEDNDQVFGPNNTTTDDVYRFDTPNLVTETTVALSTGGRTALSMGGSDDAVVPSVQVGTDDNVGGTAFLSQVRLSDFVNNATTVFGASDGQTFFSGGIFYDKENTDWHVGMAADLTLLARVTDPVGTVSERYTFATCLSESGVSCVNNANGSMGYSARQAALYVTNTASPASVVKIDTCATGGP